MIARSRSDGAPFGVAPRQLNHRPEQPRSRMRLELTPPIGGGTSCMFSLAELERIIPLVRTSVPPTPQYAWPLLKAADRRGGRGQA